MVLVINTPSVNLVVEKGADVDAVRSQTAQLTAAMRRGDDDAYREFFRLYFHRLLAYLIVLTHGDESLAQDLLQQTMIKVAKHIRILDHDEILWRWLTLIARTTAFDHSRKTTRYFGFLQHFWATRTSAPEPPVPNEAAFQDALAAGLELLDSEERSILGKKYFDGASVRQIAADLSLSEKAVESRLTRARAKLKEQLLKRLAHE
jgi:RNA polymerase sigma factor CnrH